MTKTPRYGISIYKSRRRPGLRVANEDIRRPLTALAKSITRR